MDQQGHGHPPAVARLSDDPVHGDPGLVQEDLVEVGHVGHLVEGADLHAGLAHGDHQHGDAGVLGDVPVGPGQEDAEVGMIGTGGPHLLTGDHPLVAIANGSGGETGQIRSGTGLRIELAPVLVAPEPGAQEPLS
jgi:hypothetical protein